MLVYDGAKYIDVEEGTLRLPPPAPPARPQAKWVKPKQKGRKRPMYYHGATLPGEAHATTRKEKLVPGFREWRMMRSKEIQNLTGRQAPLERQGARHLTPRGLKRCWTIARRRAKEDMEKIKKVVDLDSAAEEALETTLVIMRAPGKKELQLKAARQILDFTKAKPVAKSEVTINTAEDWLASLTEDKSPNEPDKG